MEEFFTTVRETGANGFPFHRSIPIRSRSDCAAVGGKTNQNSLFTKVLFRQLANIELAAILPARPLLSLAITPDLPRLREALDAEVRAEQEKDRIYWAPLKREMEEFRRAERESS